MFFSFWTVKPIERFLSNNPATFQRAFGYVLGVGITKELTPCQMKAFTEQLTGLLNDHSTEEAWEEYKNSCLAHPTDQRYSWPMVESTVSYLLRHELLADFALPRAEPRPEIRYWTPLDHLARFILRVNFNHLQQEKEDRMQSQNVHTWSVTEHWLCAYLLFELVQGLQGPKPPPSPEAPELEEEPCESEHDNSAGVGLKCQNASSWNFLRRLI